MPEERDAYLRLVRETAVTAQDGEPALVHCAAGIGRTGMFAASLLPALGIEKQGTLRLTLFSPRTGRLTKSATPATI